MRQFCRIIILIIITIVIYYTTTTTTTITDRQTDGQTDEHRGNSMVIRFNERIAH